jgi:uncharacterized repeat protein (TIGR03803 family)
MGDAMFSSISNFAAVTALAIAASAGIADARGLRVLHAFKGGKDGASPTSGLVADGQGNFYGATNAGGQGNCNSGDGCGTVFKIDASGRKSTVYVFKGKKDGGSPSGDLTVGPDGSIYGATQQAGSSCGCGTVYKIRPDGTEKTLYQFQGGSDGAGSRAGVILDADGNLYGTTQQGGTGSCQGGCGTVFKLTPTGTKTVVHNFTGGSDGEAPAGGLVFDSSGNLFGTTESGGGNCDFGNCGTLFKIASNGVESIVHAFGGDVEDGYFPFGRLIIASDGNLWGTTLEGGDHIRGTLYKVSSHGQETPVWAFGAFQDGAYPDAGVIQGPDGNLYGTLPTDGSEGPGYIFKWSIADQTESIVYAFPVLPAGRAPSGTLAFDASGNIYGTTVEGGGNHGQGCDPNGCGEAYRLPAPK